MRSSTGYRIARAALATLLVATLWAASATTAQSHTLTYTAGPDGSISGDSPQTVNSGDDGSAVTAVPDTGYHFVDWSDSSTDNPRTDTNVTGDISVTANFAIDTYTLTYTAGPNGSISGDSPQTVNYAASGTPVTAVPDTGYHFVDWSDNLTDNPRTDPNVTGDISVTANFAIDTYTLTYTAGPNGSVSGDSPQTVNHGSDGTPVTAVPDTGYHFVDWSDNSTDNPRTDTNVTGDISVTANFAIDTFTLTYTAGPNGSISGDSPQTVNYGADGTAVTAVPDTGYHFVDWSDNSTDNPRTDTNVTGDISVTANFAINTYTLTYTAGSNGSISGDSPQTVNQGADGTPVTAVPDPGYRFVNWSDNSTDNPRTDTNVTADVSVTANFAALPALAIDNQTHAEGDSLTTTFTFTVTRTGDTTIASSVAFTTQDDTATVGDLDYQTNSGTLNFAPGETMMTIDVLVNGDTKVENNETFKVILSSPTDATITTADGTGTITNDDTNVSVAVSPAPVVEDGAANLVYTFTRNPQTSGDVTVNFTVGGTALFADDYTQSGAATFTTTSGTVVILDGQTTATVTLDPTADNIAEQDETAVLTVTSGSGYNVGSPDAATGTIVNDDTSVTVTVSPLTVVEDGAPNLVYTFTRNPVLSGPKTISFSVGGTATFNTDYTVTGADSFSSSSGTVTFADGSDTATVTVDPTVDSVYESDETVILTVSSGSGYSAGTPGAATGTITNDDSAPTLSIGDRIANEGNIGGPTNFVFTVTKSGSTEVPVTVNFATANGTTNPATGGAACGPGVDYVSQTGALTFPASGAGSTSQTITVAVCTDTVVEPNETFFVELSGETNATITDGEGRGTIQNDDVPPPLVPVNTTDDLNDGTCNAAHCSLREAINTANASSGAVSITFAIPADDHNNPGGSRHFYYVDDNIPNHVTNDATHVVVTTAATDATLPADKDPDWPHSWWSILPTSVLPTITQTVTIDGYSQTGATANTVASMDNAVLKIELDGANAGASAIGLTVSAVTSNVKGLVVNRFTSHGLSLSGGNVTISGNFIGTDVSGTLDLGNSGHGIASSGFSGSIGGSTPADVNLISGNDGDGVAFSNSNSNLVLGNFIGTAANGTSALGNTGNGISLTGGGSVFNTVGGTQSADRNVIAFNGGDGVQVGISAGVSNTIRGNSIFSNGTTASHLGIDLGPDGVTPNDPKDPDGGANGLQNFPIITSALATGSTKTVTGTLNSRAGEVFEIDFYANTSCDGLNGEGQTYLGSVTTSATDTNGDVTFTFHPDASHASAMAVDKFITATATSTGAFFDTSEFSACFKVLDGSDGAGDIQFTSATYTIGEAGGTAAITVTRFGDSSNGSVTANLSATNGTAGASDYTLSPNPTSITYIEGETGTKTVNVTINNDNIYESNETVNLTLSATQINSPDYDPDQAINPHAAVLTIVDNDSPPSFAIDDVSHNEGNSSTTAYVFTVTKTGATEVTASVKFQAQDGSATQEGNDYRPASGTLTFTSTGQLSQQVTVLVNGDTEFESDETFIVHLSNAVNGTISRADGTGTIVNDDAEPTPTATPTATATATATPTATATATPAATPTATPTAAPLRALNISTRLRVDTGDNVMIAGFIITGNISKAVVLRGMGPSLASFGIPDVLLDPVLDLRAGNSSLILSNDNWKDTQRSQIEGTVFQPTDDRESVIVATLIPANYTAVLTGKNNTTGVGIVEAYDNNLGSDSELANISTRGFVQNGNNVMIGGFILGGSQANARIALRGIGPSLSQFGLTNLLADPTLELHDANGATLVANDNWTDDPASAALLTANGLGLSDPKESGIFTSLPPGQFTAILAGKNGGIGIGLVEIYNLK